MEGHEVVNTVENVVDIERDEARAPGPLHDPRPDWSEVDVDDIVHGHVEGRTVDDLVAEMEAAIETAKGHLS